MSTEFKDIVNKTGLQRFKDLCENTYGKVKSVQNVSPDNNGNVAIPDATTSKSGLMSSSDKSTLNGLNTSVGSATQPIYFVNGVPTKTTYTLGANVPSNAVFTDTNTKVTNILATTTKAYITGTTSDNTNTDTQVFDTGVYLGITAGELVATKFTGALNGTAAKATADASGNVITSTYETKANAITGLSVSGKVITYTKGNGTTGTITTQDTTYSLSSFGVTATASELNALDGITATVTELNYTDGVTSNIQTQLNAKAALANPTFTGTPKAPTATAGTNTTQIATTAFVTTAVANKTSVSGNAGTATKLETARTISISGDATGSNTFDGSDNKDIAITLASSGVTAGSYGPSSNASPAHKGTFSVPYITVDAKGRVTSASTKTITLPADNNTTYTSMTASEATTGTATTARSITAKVLNDKIAEMIGTSTGNVYCTCVVKS